MSIEIFLALLTPDFIFHSRNLVPIDICFLLFEAKQEEEKTGKKSLLEFHANRTLAQVVMKTAAIVVFSLLQIFCYNANYQQV